MMPYQPHKGLGPFARSHQQNIPRVKPLFAEVAQGADNQQSFQAKEDKRSEKNADNKEAADILDFQDIGKAGEKKGRQADAFEDVKADVPEALFPEVLVIAADKKGNAPNNQHHGQDADIGLQGIESADHVPAVNSEIISEVIGNKEGSGNKRQVGGN
jgi:hypothetical protein